MKWIALVAALALSGVACGRSQEDRPADANRQRVEQRQGTAGVATESGGVATGGTSSAGGGDVKPVEPVSVVDLVALLPEPFGWERERPDGRRMTSPVNFSVASVRLMKGDATVTAKISDSAFNRLFMTPLEPFLDSDYEHKTDRGYEKSVKVGDAPGREKWDAPTRSGNLMIVVNRRFVVEIDGSTIDDPKTLHDLLGGIDLKKLADLR